MIGYVRVNALMLFFCFCMLCSLLEILNNDVLLHFSTNTLFTLFTVTEQLYLFYQYILFLWRSISLEAKLPIKPWVQISFNLSSYSLFKVTLLLMICTLFRITWSNVEFICMKSDKVIRWWNLFSFQTPTNHPSCFFWHIV